MTTQIEPHVLKPLIDRNAVKVLDGSWALDGTDMRTLFMQSHIPGAQFFDIEAISDRSTALPHMAPSTAQFAAAVGAMGISETDHVVIYDRQGLFSAARVWWTFKLMGHENVQVLRGGLPVWIAAGLPIEADVSTPVPTTYLPRSEAGKLIDMSSLKILLQKPDVLILDARPRARFEGAAPEPRAGLRSGHMPGSQSLPFGELIREGALKPKDELKVIFETCGVSDARSLVTTCGSGVTAAIITLALSEAGYANSRLYDGSWAEWGQESLDTPVITAGT